jgi:hypothetical protein
MHCASAVPFQFYPRWEGFSPSTGENLRKLNQVSTEVLLEPKYLDLHC